MKRILHTSKHPSDAVSSCDAVAAHRCRLLTIAAATLILCSCQAIQPDLSRQQATRPGRVNPSLVNQGLPAAGFRRTRDQTQERRSNATLLPGSQAARAPAASGLEQRSFNDSVASPAAVGQVALVGYGAPVHSQQACGLPNCTSCGGYPPALPAEAFAAAAAQYWPGDVRLPEEYLCNGGDRNVGVRVKRDWTVQGLQAGDTVGHYDRLDGQVEVESSNNVCLYAPRFAAVRKIYGVVLHEQHERGLGLAQPISPVESGDAQPATTVVQPLQLRRQLARTSSQTFRDKTLGTGVENLRAAAEAEGDTGPYEDFLIIRRGQFDNSEKARLTTRLRAAHTWTHNKAVQVVIDNRMAVEDSGDLGAQSVYRFEMPPGKPRLRIVKVASQENAKTGETIDFTIRFDNLGNEPIGNVTIIDNLVTRLEYVPDSQDCSLEADFQSEPNTDVSLTLRWEIKEPLQVGKGGVIRFKCRVR